MQKFSQFGYIFFFSVCLCSCTKDKIVIVENTCPEEVSYSIQVKQIINETCAYVECHDSGGNVPGDFTSYARMVNFLTEDLFVKRTINLRDMPPNYATGQQFLTQEQLDILICWIESGYKE